MSYPAYPPPPAPQRRGPSTAVIAVVTVLAVLVAGVVLGGAALVAFRAVKGSDDSATGGTPSAEPAPSPTAPLPSTAPTLDRFYDQKLRWRNCGGNECTRLRVPLDYAHPDGRTITIAVNRVPATERRQRIGQLVVNPGGPGVSGLEFAAGGSQYFGDEITRVYDLVGFDPRGIGQSAAIECLDTRETDDYLASDPDPDTPAEVQRFAQWQTDFGEGCVRRSGQLAAHISTVEVAKDVDVLRAALKEPKLDYMGASYGTFLGATYADLFPTHVGRMVLDGALDPSLSSEQLSLVQAKGFQTALDAYLDDCTSQAACPLGDSVSEANDRLTTFLADVDAKPLPGSGGRELTEGTAVYGIFLPLYLKSLWPLLTDALKAALRGDGSRLQRLADQYNSRGPGGYDDNSAQALLAVNCLDHGDSTPLTEVPAKVAEFEKVSPVFGRVFAYSLAGCDGWPVGSGQPTHAIKAPGAPPIVVIGTTRDPATPYSMAVGLARQLSQGRLITRDGDGHTGFHMGNNCVDDAVASYLTDDKLPPPNLHC